MAELAIAHLDQLRDTFPEPAKDIKLNLGSVLNSEFLDPAQVWGIALASAFYLRDEKLKDAILADARAANVADEVVADAKAAAALMGMNTVYYRFRHLVGKESYSKRPARLRMQWMAQPKTNKANFELNSLAIAALAGCETCIKAHEASVLKIGLTEEHVHDAVRIAAVIGGAAVALHLQ